MTFEALIASGTPVLIDGGLSTQLESMGCALTDSLWTARTLIDDPSIVTAAHRAFVDAGSELVISASYQVSRAGFERVGLSAADADHALRASVSAARAAGVLVAASVGPYGAIAHDGGEYRGRYGRSLDELASFHAERIAVLVDAAPDLLAVETIPDADEARALAEVLPTDMPAWVCFTAADDAHLRSGHRVEEGIAVFAGHAGVRAIGINCTEPHHLPALIARIRAVSALPIVVYPNAGGSWDAQQGAWVGPTEPVGAAMASWIAAGATIVGGCCGTDADDIAEMARTLAMRA